MAQQPQQTYPCCASALFLVLFLVILGSCVGGDDEKPAPTSPTRPTLRDPGYTSSLCEGSDYALYDDCN
ncbi:hypothetical protein HHL19_36320 [Streptomyces sp. R302]|uniref:hypothetical protein n=1 Tax=unclassified Streptomyces TaxID=2593676 RepID=UPI00145F385E|nr:MULTISPECIES: hypothetical protein [unclassified Streptomyces]NML55681.1 hypothetical protein [Streptomyces sp. R301]NML83977.1 hypothetical protein [Streptomyces sp. R302]